MKQKISFRIILFFLFVLGMFQSKVYAQVEPDYGDWLFIQGDKAVQARYALIKEEDDISYFKVQLRINFEDEIFSDVNSEGYVVAFGFPTYDNKTTDFKHFLIYNTFKGVHTIDELMSLRTKFPGSRRFYVKDRGFV